ncbi:histidine phosphatase family protein [Aeromicrobium fastidiosum]|uniref:Histidine phosphatase family protein n=1 Tax=Aeromicrobium fastidiosum TaxID=52699 RepID=A0A641AIG6_9ACTN|nr:histidine phosphatase family protein [Aeromicrobium fastidiosum]KAA1373023.1 histidine phosphatase family protein [Aeromicrobium fastidiosum]MBP2390997.1 putative phosphoglycerate mutase [Aeromicrobium fastidiosum]
MSSADGVPTELWLVRHGETEWSRTGQHTSVTDLELTADGEAIAARLQHPLADQPFARVLASPRRRARRTAELAGFAAADVDDDLAEWAYGDYEGLTTPQIHESDPAWSVWTGVTPGGETAQQVAARLDRVVAAARDIEGRTLVFAHGHSLRALAARWLGLDVAQGRIFDLDTATISVLGDDRGIPVVRRWNVAPR